MKARLPANEDRRIESLREHGILDTSPEREYDDVVLLASQICNTPMAAISLIDVDRQWFKARIGIEETETPREQAFCAHAILNPSETMIVTDATEDVRFRDNPFVTSNPGVRFYAGTPLVTADECALGTLCVIDDKPRTINEQQVAALEALARQLSLRLELKRTSELLREANERLQNLSLTDELTGLYNRRGFFLHAEQQLKLYRSRESARSLWLMVGDMDGLKHINDTYGHPEGSTAIKAMGEVLVRSFRDADIIARPGGDEFAALIPNTLDEVVRRVPERLKANLDHYNATSGKPYKLGISVGMVKIPFGDESTIAEMVKKADAAMYEDKRSRKSPQP